MEQPPRLKLDVAPVLCTTQAVLCSHFRGRKLSGVQLYRTVYSTRNYKCYRSPATGFARDCLLKPCSKSERAGLSGGKIQTDASAVAAQLSRKYQEPTGHYTKRSERDESGDSEGENDQIIFTPQSTSSLSFKTQPNAGALRGAPRVPVLARWNLWSIPGHSNTSHSRR